MVSRVALQTFACGVSGCLFLKLALDLLSSLPTLPICLFQTIFQANFDTKSILLIVKQKSQRVQRSKVE